MNFFQLKKERIVIAGFMLGLFLFVQYMASPFLKTAPDKITPVVIDGMYLTTQNDSYSLMTSVYLQDITVMDAYNLALFAKTNNIPLENKTARIAKIKIRNLNNESIKVNYKDFKFTDTEGKVYSPSEKWQDQLASSQKKAFKETTIKTGEIGEGLLVIDIPNEVSLQSITYAPSGNWKDGASFIQKNPSMTFEIHPVNMGVVETNNRNTDYFFTGSVVAFLLMGVAFRIYSHRKEDDEE